MRLQDIKEHANRIDTEEVSILLIEKVESGEFSTYFDAFMNFVEESDIDDTEVLDYLSPFMIDKMKLECISLGLIHDDLPKNSISLFCE